MTVPIRPNGQRDLDRDTNFRADAGHALLLFPGCDPRGVLSRALSPGASAWTTRPDALIFGWLLALPPEADSAAAAGAVLTVASGRDPEGWTTSQRRLLLVLESVMRGTQGRPASG